MHEFALYSQVSKTEQPRILEQLAGVTRMQPRPMQEIHVVFKAQSPPGLNNIPSIGGSQGIVQQELQRVKSMLGTSLYYVKLVGEVMMESEDFESTTNNSNDVVMSNGDSPSSNEQKKIQWYLDFRDIPDAGKQMVSMRLMSKTPLIDGDLMRFMQNFGYEYVSRYLVTGSKFYDQETTITLYKLKLLPQVPAEQVTTNARILLNENEMQDFDGSGGFTLQVSIEVTDGNNPELKDRATRQLLIMKETLKPAAISLKPGDRLALDSRLPLMSYRN